MTLSPLTVPVTVAVVKHGYPTAVIVPVRDALLAPAFVLCAKVPETAMGAGGLTPVNKDIYAELDRDPVKLPFIGGTRTAVQVPVVASGT